MDHLRRLRAEVDLWPRRGKYMVPAQCAIWTRWGRLQERWLRIEMEGEQRPMSARFASGSGSTSG